MPLHQRIRARGVILALIPSTCLTFWACSSDRVTQPLAPQTPPVLLADGFPVAGSFVFRLSDPRLYSYTECSVSYGNRPGECFPISSFMAFVEVVADTLRFSLAADSSVTYAESGAWSSDDCVGKPLDLSSACTLLVQGSGLAYAPADTAASFTISVLQVLPFRPRVAGARRVSAYDFGGHIFAHYIPSSDEILVSSGARSWHYDRVP